MKVMELQGVARGKKVITTNPDATQPCPDDKVSRASVAQMPNQLCELMPLGGASTASVQSSTHGALVETLMTKLTSKRGVPVPD